MLIRFSLVGYVERYAALFGVQMPTLTMDQLKSKPVRRASNWVRKLVFY